MTDVMNNTDESEEDNNSDIMVDEHQPFLIQESKAMSYILDKLHFFLRTGLLGIVGAILIVVGAVLVVYMPKLIKTIVLKELAIDESSHIYKVWKHPNFPLLLSVYVFNITNYQEFLNNKAKPVLQEVGPYVYSQVWDKNQIKFNDNKTVTYFQNKTFQFEPKLSNGSDEDIVFTINTPMLSGANMFKNAGPVLKVVMTTIFSVTHESLVINTTIKQLVWDGWDDPLLNALHKILPNARYPYNRFAYFYMKNGSHDGQMTVYTGKDDYKKFTIIDKWNGMSEVKMWSGSKCNKIKGTTGEVYPPERDKKEPLTFYLPDFCRSFVIPYSGEVERFGLKAYHYETDYRLFANGSENPDNACYCRGKCLPSGAMNVSSCTFDAPIAISLPHFLFADPRYLNQVEGLKPNKSLHNTFADLEPKTGNSLVIHVRLQVNAILENIPGITQFEDVKNAVLPILWIDQTTEISSEVLQLIRIASTTSYTYGAVFSYLMIATGCFLLIVTVGYFCYQRRKWKDVEY